MKKVFILFGIILLFTSCSRFWEATKRDLQVSDRNYHIEQYSGGKLIKVYDFKGILNNSSQSDGFYFYKNDILVEISEIL